MNKIMATGHRPGKRIDKVQTLEAMQKFLIDIGNCHVISGGADGVDRLWAKAAYLTGIPFDIYVPVGYQKNYNLGPWFDSMLDMANEVHFVGTGKFVPRLNLVRNQRMVDEADICVICTDVHPEDLIKERRGGTAHCARLIYKSKKPIIWIDTINGEYMWV